MCNLAVQLVPIDAWKGNAFIVPTAILKLSVYSVQDQVEMMYPVAGPGALETIYPEACFAAFSYFQPS